MAKRINKFLEENKEPETFNWNYVKENPGLYEMANNKDPERYWLTISNGGFSTLWLYRNEMHTALAQPSFERFIKSKKSFSFKVS